MKKVYTITSDSVTEYCFTSKKKAIEQINIIKNLILSGKWFLDGPDSYVNAENYEYCNEFSYIEKESITFVFRNKRLNRLFTYRLHSQEINTNVYKG